MGQVVGKIGRSTQSPPIMIHGLSTTEKESLRNRLKLSIPESYVDEHLGDHGKRHGVDHSDQRLTAYCRKHKGFATRLYT